jgi:hypothetical protein
MSFKTSQYRRFLPVRCTIEPLVGGGGAPRSPAGGGGTLSGGVVYWRFSHTLGKWCARFIGLSEQANAHGRFLPP